MTEARPACHLEWVWTAPHSFVSCYRDEGHEKNQLWFKEPNALTGGGQHITNL